MEQYLLFFHEHIRILYQFEWRLRINPKVTGWLEPLFEWNIFILMLTADFKHEISYDTAECNRYVIFFLNLKSLSYNLLLNHILGQSLKGRFVLKPLQPKGNKQGNAHSSPLSIFKILTGAFSLCGIDNSALSGNLST